MSKLLDLPHEEFRFIVLQRIELLTIYSCPQEKDFESFLGYMKKLSSVKEFQTGYTNDDKLIRRVFDAHPTSWESVSMSFSSLELLKHVGCCGRVKDLTVFMTTFEWKEGVELKTVEKLGITRACSLGVLSETVKLSGSLKEVKISFSTEIEDLKSERLEVLSTSRWNYKIKLGGKMGGGQLDDFLPSLKRLGYIEGDHVLKSRSLEHLYTHFFYKVSQSIDHLPNLVFLHLFHTTLSMKNVSKVHPKLKTIEGLYGHVDELGAFSKMFPNVETVSFKNCNIDVKKAVFKNAKRVTIWDNYMAERDLVDVLRKSECTKVFEMKYEPRKMSRSRARRQPTQYMNFLEGFESASVVELRLVMGYDRWCPIDYKVDLEKTFQKCPKLEKVVQVYPNAKYKTRVIWRGDKTKDWPVFLVDSSGTLKNGKINMGGMLAKNIIVPKRQPLVKSPKDYGMEFSDVEFTTKDSVKIKGWYIPSSKESDKLIIVTHPMPFTRYGFSTKHQGMFKVTKLEVELLQTAKVLHENNYNVLTFDFRNHGESDSGSEGYCGVGLHEYHDVVGCMEYVKADEKLQNMQVAFVSHCMGANSTIIAMSKEQELFNGVKCLFAIQPVSMNVLIPNMLKDKYPVFKNCYDDINTKVKSYSGNTFEDMSPLNYVKDITCPVMYSQVVNDPWTEKRDIQAIFDATPKNDKITDKELYWIEGEKRERFDGYNYFWKEKPDVMVEFLGKYFDEKEVSEEGDEKKEMEE